MHKESGGERAARDAREKKAGAETNTALTARQGACVRSTETFQIEKERRETTKQPRTVNEIDVNGTGILDGEQREKGVGRDGALPKSQHLRG